MRRGASAVRVRAATVGRPYRRGGGGGDSRTVRQFGIGGCVSLMAREFGDHPEAARDRMRWVWQLVGDMPAARRTGQSGAAPVRSFPDAARPATDGARRAA